MKTTRFSNAKEMETWLAKNHASEKELWLEIAKKGSGISTPTYAEALDVALCFGWIDAQKKSVDEATWVQRFTLRTKTSKWSKVNRDKADALVKAKRMRPAGLLQMEAAKKDGRWESAYDGPKKSLVPPDLEKALAKNPTARRFFEELDSANRFAILYRLQTTKNPELRAKKVVTFVAMCTEGKKIHETPRKKRASKIATKRLKRES